MGCCCSKEDETDIQNGNSDRSRLLNPVSDSDIAPSSLGYGTSSPGQPENLKEKALNDIIAQAAKDTIDICALDTQYYQQNDYSDRVKAYQACLKDVDVNVLKSKPNLMNKRQPPITILNKDNNAEDINQIREFAVKVEKLINDFHMEKKDPLVVPFFVPNRNN